MLQTLQTACGKRTEHGDDAQFRTTHWSVVLLAGGDQTAESAASLEKLCRTYWYPLYAFVRRQGYDPHEAQDLTQEFFCRFIESQALRSADPAKGKFRSFLIGALKNLLANEWDRTTRLKRGGGREIFSWDGLTPEERYLFEPAESTTPERQFDQQWARTLVAVALAKLRGECGLQGTDRRFEVLKVFLSGDPGGISYAEAARQLELSESAAKSAVHRLRQRYAELFRAEVAHTVNGPAEVEAEIRHLFTALSS